MKKTSAAAIEVFFEIQYIISEALKATELK